MTPTEIGAQLRKARKARDWTLRDVHERTGLSVSHVSNAERGHHASSTTLERLASLYGLVCETHTTLYPKGAKMRSMVVPASLASLADEVAAAPADQQELLADVVRACVALTPEWRAVLRDQAEVMAARVARDSDDPKRAAPASRYSGLPRK